MGSQFRLPFYSHSFAGGNDENPVDKILPRGNWSKRIPNANNIPLIKANNLMHMYVKRGSMVDARYVFDSMPKWDLVSWNIMILGYAKKEEIARAWELYTWMHLEGVQPNDRTFVGILTACSSLATFEEAKQANWKSVRIGCLEKGRGIHSQVVMNGFESDVFVGTTLVNMYAKCWSMEDAWHVFNELTHRNVVTWNTMIMGYADREDIGFVLELFAQMHQEGVTADPRTLVGALKSCSSLVALEEGLQGDRRVVLATGRALHSQVVRSSFESHVIVGTTLVNMYAKWGIMDDAYRVFNELHHRDVVTWNTMILGYAELQERENALRLYAQMQEQGVSPSTSTFAAILKASGNTAALETGKELHSQINRVGFETSAIVASSLIDMYAKCGSMSDAQQLFDALPKRNVVAWGALIAGYARQGESERVFHLFERMRQEGVHPDEVTFSSVLSVCSHVGLVDKGKEYFETMSKQYGIIPTSEHYSCMVDLLGRAGQLQEAVAMVETMPFRPSVIVWLTMLGACRKWKNVEVGMHAFQNLVRLEEKHPASYVLMADIYADAHLQDDYDKIQVIRKKVQA